MSELGVSECPAYAPTESGGGQRREEDRIYDNYYNYHVCLRVLCFTQKLNTFLKILISNFNQQE